MKQRSTTPALRTIVTKGTLLAASSIMVISSALYIQPEVHADRFDDQIKAIQREIDAYQQEAQKFRDQANTLQSQLQLLSNERARIEGQIELSRAQYDKLQQQIKETEQNIKDNQVALGNTLADLYITDTISPLEMLASSKNIGDYVDKQEYRAAIRDQLTKKIDKIRNLKKALEVQRNDVQRVLGDQINAQNALIAKHAEQQQLLSSTQGQEGAYQRLSAESSRRKLEVQRQQQAAIEAAMQRASGGMAVNILPGDPNKGGYPWEANCYVDDNAVSHGGYGGNGTDPLGYGCRQCVSYTAYKVGARTGHYPRYWGNANQWPGSAKASGYQTGTTPKENAVGVISDGAYGHVVWVEAVNGDGTVDVSQYNYFNAGGTGWGHYSKMRVSASTYDTYIYF